MTHCLFDFINQYTNTLNNRQINKARNQYSRCLVVLATGTWIIDGAVIATRESGGFTMHAPLQSNLYNYSQ